METLSLGMLLDRSFKIAASLYLEKLLIVFLIFSLLMGGLQAAPPGIQMVGGLLLNFLNTWLFICIVYFVSEYWKGKTDASLGDVLGRASFRTFLRLLLLGLFISLGCMAGPLVGGLSALLLSLVLGLSKEAGMILAFLLVAIGAIPSFIFYLDRVLATCIIILEDVTAQEGCVASKSLMTRTPRLRQGSPFRRLGAVTFCIFIIATAIGLGFSSLTLSITDATQSTILLVGIGSITSFVTQFTSCFSITAYVGFYHDLLVRYEARDILSTLDQLRGENDHSDYRRNTESADTEPIGFPN